MAAKFKGRAKKMIEFFKKKGKRVEDLVMKR